MRVVEPMMLLLLAQEPRHGYALVDTLTTTFGVSALPPQTIYRALQAMEEAGWVRSDWDVEETQGPPRRVYRITPEGEVALDAWSLEMDELRQMLETFLDAYQNYRR